MRTTAELLDKNVTLLLRQWRGGDSIARDLLFDSVYADLTRVARNRLTLQYGPVTLNTRELVAESMLRLLGKQPDFQDRRQFVAVAALKMRSVLIDHLRSQQSERRGGKLQRFTLSHADERDEDIETGHEIMALHQALEQLTELDSRVAAVIDLSYFGGLTREEIAQVLEIAVATVDRDLRFARAWLNSQLG